jgi:protein O-mannosyl-transferase
LLISSLVLGLLTLFGYWKLSQNSFVVLDDPSYIYENPHVQAGLTWDGIRWAFTTGHAGNWHPFTWISHMVDCQLFGLNPGSHHLGNLLLHVANSILLLLLLHSMTGTLWRSLAVAALFAWHPVHVESVAWASERKDVLSTFFFLLTLLAYVSHTKVARTSSDGKTVPGVAASRSYFLALALYGCSLMSKPMVVTLPFVLLLADVWPLQRFRLPRWKSEGPRPAWRNATGLLLEKVPFFALSAGTCVVTCLVQNAGGAVNSLHMLPLVDRIANAAVAYAKYVGKTVVPTDLSVFYPMPNHLPLVFVAGAVLFLLGISALVLRAGARRPYLAVGWFWFVGTLVPAIGLVQVGSQAMADRYLYIPSIGLFVMAAWSVAELVRHNSPTRWVVPAASTAALAACLRLTAIQVGYWHDEERLFRHAAACTTDNYLAYDHVAKVCEASGRNDEAVAYYSALLVLKPKNLEAQYNLGTLLMQMGRVRDAVEHLERAVNLNPNFASAQSNLGLALFRLHHNREAVDHLELAARLNPQDPDTQVNRGVMLLAMNYPQEAADSFSRAVKLAPANPTPHFLLASALAQESKCDEAALRAIQARELALSSGDQDLAAKAQSLAEQCRASSPDL